MTSLDEWWDQGSTVEINGRDGQPQEIFIRQGGRGSRIVTFIHGYPGSSYDWHEVSEQLEPDFRTLAIDLLGYGASSKPRPHAWSLEEQADIIEQIWERAGVERTLLVAHDMGSSVALELLARELPALEAVVLLNGGLYPELHRPTDGQQMLLGPDGEALAAVINQELFQASVAATFGSRAPATPEQLESAWQAMARSDGNLLLATLLHYIHDRRRNEQRWTTAMETTSVPLTFVWGPEDPVSGAHMLAGIRERVTGADIVELPGVGHWPELEDPTSVAAAIRGAAERLTGS